MFSLLFGKKKEFKDELQEFQAKVDALVTDILSSSQDDVHQNLMTLQSPDKCNEYAIILSDELGKKYQSLELEQFVDKIYMAPLDSLDKNIKSKDKHYTKKQLCDGIANHYIRILNLIASVLTAINPQYNMCLRRISALYETTEENLKQGTIRICDDNDKSNPLYPTNLLQIPGFQEMLNLYYFHMVQNVSDANEKATVEKDYQLLVRAFNEILVDGAEQMPPSLNHNEPHQNNQNNNSSSVNNNNNNNDNEINHASVERRKYGSLNSLRNSLSQKLGNKTLNNNNNNNNGRNNALKNNALRNNVHEIKGKMNNMSSRLNNLNRKLDEIAQQKSTNSEPVAESPSININEESQPSNSDNGQSNGNGNAGNNGESNGNGNAGNNGESNGNGNAGNNGQSNGNRNAGNNGQSNGNRNAGTNGESNGAGTNGESNGAGTNGEYNGAGTNGESNGAGNSGTNGESNGAGNSGTNGESNGAGNSGNGAGNSGNGAGVSLPPTNSGSANNNPPFKIPTGNNNGVQEAVEEVTENSNKVANNMINEILADVSQDESENGKNKVQIGGKPKKKSRKQKRHRGGNRNSMKNNNNNNNSFSENSELSENSEQNNNNNNNANNRRKNTKYNNNNGPSHLTHINYRDTKGDIDGKIQAFKLFVENYYSHPQLTSQVFDILNKIPLDYTNKSELCFEETDEGVKPRVIDIDSNHFRDFKRNYQNLQNHYTKMTDQLSQILENILITDSEEKRHLKSLTSPELSAMEQNARTLLKDYYSGCQNMYMLSVRELEKAVIAQGVSLKQSAVMNAHSHENRLTGKAKNNKNTQR
jgi:hypothetical protein